jgi:hypothetical protein
MWLTTVPTVLANAVIIPFVIIYAYGSSDAYIPLALTVAGGEIVTASICGSLLYYQLKRVPYFSNMTLK